MSDKPLQEQVHVVIPSTVVSDMIVKAVADLTEDQRDRYGSRTGPPKLYGIVQRLVEEALTEHVRQELATDLAAAFVRAAANHFRVDR